MNQAALKRALALALSLFLLTPLGALALSIGESITDIRLDVARETPGVSVSQIVESQEELPAEPDISSVTVFTITNNGIYRFSGELDGGQIRVDAPKADQIQIILSGVRLSNPSGPAIYIRSAAEAGEGAPPSVRLTLEAGTQNMLHGAAYAERADQGGQLQRGEGAVSSEVSLSFDGEGSLSLIAEKAGIEGRSRLLFEGGHLSVNAGTDAVRSLSALERAIEITGGYLAAASQGGQGSGLRSAGGITVSGGTLIATADPAGGAGLNAALGTCIDGGTVISSGASYGPISERSAQRFIHLAFQHPMKPDDPIVITEEEGRAVLAYAPPAPYTHLTLSSPTLVEGRYRLFQGGSLDGQAENGLYPAGTAYLPGTPLQSGGSTRDEEVISALARPAQTSSPRPDPASESDGALWSAILPQTRSGGAVSPLPPVSGPESASALPSPQPTAPGSVISSVFTLSSQSYFFVNVQRQE